MKKKKMKLSDYNNTQIIDEKEIKCSKCSMTKAEASNGQFYYCFECEQNFCPLCRDSHKEHENIVDFTLKYFKCPQHYNRNFFSYCFDCKKNICLVCGNHHKEHKTISFSEYFLGTSKENIEKIKKVNESVDNIINSLKKFKENLDVYVQINKKLNDNLSNNNLNYENVTSMKNLMEISFLEEDLNQILNSNDVNKKFRKIMSMYDVMIGKNNKVINIDEAQNEKKQEEFKVINVINIFEEQNVKTHEKIKENNINELLADQVKKSPEERNEITLKIKIEQKDIDKTIYFLDDTQGSEVENFNGNNITLIIEGEVRPFKNCFIPRENRTYSIKLVFKNKISNCSNMFYQCKNIAEIDFSKFNTENVTDMNKMFFGCSGLKSLNLKSFNTENVSNMEGMFIGCSSLTAVNLSSFNTKNVTNMSFMFGSNKGGCTSLKILDLSSFNSTKVTNMHAMFYKCFELQSIDLKSFNTENVTDMAYMFYGCSNLTSLVLSSFNTKNTTDMNSMFSGCSSLSLIKLTSFNTKKVINMTYIFYRCSNLALLGLSSFNQYKSNNKNY